MPVALKVVHFQTLTRGPIPSRPAPLVDASPAFKLTHSNIVTTFAFRAKRTSTHASGANDVTNYTLYLYQVRSPPML